MRNIEPFEFFVGFVLGSLAGLVSSRQTVSDLLRISSTAMASPSHLAGTLELSVLCALQR